MIAGGGLDLSVGSMAALVAGVMILTLNGAGSGGVETLALGMVVAVSAFCGLVNGLVTTFGRIEPFIVTLGTMGIFRALVVWQAEGGTITMRNFELRELYRPDPLGVGALPHPLPLRKGVLGSPLHSGRG